MSDRSAQLQRMLQQAFKSYQQGRLDETGRLCSRILRSLPGEPNALHLQGVVHLMNGRMRRATETLRRAAEIDRGNAGVLTSLATALRQTGDIDQAEEVYRRAGALEPERVDPVCGLADLYRESGRPYQAAECYRRALDVEPAHESALNGLGLALADAGEATEALQAFQRAMIAHPDSPIAFRNAAALLARHGDWETTLACCDAALALTSDDVAALSGRCRALGELGDMDAAEATFRVAREIAPGSADPRLAFGRALMANGRCDAALEWFDEALLLAPDNSALLCAAGDALAQSGRPDAALVQFDRAILHSPEDTAAWVRRGDALRRLGRIEMALESYQTAVACAPNDRDAMYRRAQTRLALGDYTGGWSDYRARPAMREPPAGLYRDLLPIGLSGRRFVLIEENGAIEPLFFLRFAPCLAERGAALFYDKSGTLGGLAARTGLFEDWPDDEAATADALRVALGDLPYLLGSESSPHPPALKIVPHPAVADRAAARLAAAGPPPRIGITWPSQRAEADVPPLDALLSAVSDSGATVVVLQCDPHDDNTNSVAASGSPVADLSPATDDMEMMLALVGDLDEHIGVHGAGVELRAAAGRASRALIANDGDFRWLSKGTRSPWHPETPIYRQASGGSWDAALTWLARDLLASRTTENVT